MQTSRRNKRKQRGSILLLSIFFLIVLFSLSVAFFRIIPSEFHSASNSRRQIQATYAADAGIRHAVTFLKATMSSNDSHIITPAQIATFNNKRFGSDNPSGVEDSNWPKLSRNDPKLLDQKVDEDWSYLTHIRMNESPFFRRVYEVEAASYYRGRPITVIRTTVQNESFAKYALFYDTWNANFIFSMKPNGIQGPLHTNGFFRLAVPNEAFWSATQVKDGATVPADPWVSGPLARMTQAKTFSINSTDPANTLGITGDGMQYANGNSFQANLGLVPFTETGSPISNRYSKIIDGGRSNITQIGKVDMPQSNADLRIKAWGTTPPGTTAQWNSTVNGAGTVLVNTDAGQPNVPGAKVNGGIFIRGSNADEVLLDLTPEGHQVTRVRQGSYSVADATRNSYEANVPLYHREVVEPARQEPTWDCASWSNVQVANYHSVQYSEERTETNASRCGTRTEYVAGEGGVNQPIQVPNSCTFTVTWSNWEPDGTFRTERQCTGGYVPGPPRQIPENRYWTAAQASDAGAVPSGQTERRTVNADYPGAVLIPGKRDIQNWNSVVEVNDTDYTIPWYSGIKVNGQTIPSSSDPRLVVPAGNTVTIKSDFKDSVGDYAEYTVMEGSINGVVFSDVHLYNVRGTAKGSKYEDSEGNTDYSGKVLATNIAAGKNVEIRDSILQYYNGPDASKNDGSNRLAIGQSSPDQKHIFGIFANEVLIKPSGLSNTYEDIDTAWRENGNVGGRPFRGGRFRGGINVYGVLMAGRVDSSGNSVGGFGAHNNAMDSNDYLGDFNLYGGIISAHAKLTQKTVGGHANGFRLNLNYDEIAAEFLEYLPSTNNFACLRYVTYGLGAGVFTTQ